MFSILSYATNGLGLLIPSLSIFLRSNSLAVSNSHSDPPASPCGGEEKHQKTGADTTVKATDKAKPGRRAVGEMVEVCLCFVAIDVPVQRRRRDCMI